MIIFVGDKPSKRMKPGAKPFSGASCEKRLMDWISKIIESDINYAINNKDDIHLARTRALVKINGWKIIALGNNASNHLDSIPHFKLPHPSGLNRQINDKTFINDKLKECKKWLKNSK